MTYRDTISVFLPDAFGLCFPLLEGVLVLKLGFHSIESVRITTCDWLITWPGKTYLVDGVD
jgi:hypothetical protein